MRYLIGYSENAWNFVEAYHDAQNGDIFELESDYSIDFDVIEGELKKSLTFVGVIKKGESGNNIYMNTFRGKVVCSGEVTVSFKNIWFELRENTTVLWAKNKANVIVENSYFAGDYPSNKKYLIFVEEKSKMTLDDTYTRLPETHNEGIKVIDNSTLEIKNSTIKPHLILNNNSKLIARNSTFENYASNTFNLQDSSLDADHITVRGGNLEKDYPMIRLKKSDAIIKNSQLDSEMELSSVCGFYSTITIEETQLSSITLWDSSTAELKNTTIADRINAQRTSYVYLSDSCTLECKNPKKIPIYLNDKSVVMGDKVIFHKLFTPNIRSHQHSAVILEKMEIINDDRSKIKVDFDETSKNFIKEEVVAPTSAFGESTEQDSYETLQQLVGLESVKRTIDEMISLVVHNQMRIAKGEPAKKQNLHSVFYGNPGTGKTTVARLIGKILYDKGVITGKQFKFVEVDASDLLSGYVNQTAEKTKEKLEEAIGGVLFIDEAYALNKKGSNDTGKEAISTIMKFMEDRRDEIMIIFAGYTKQMEEFLASDPGLRGRIGNYFNFDDYTPDQIVSMGMKIFEKEHYKLTDPDYYARKVKKEYQVSIDKSNARWIRTFNEKITNKLAFRVVNEKGADISLVTNADIDAVVSMGSYEDNGSQRDAFKDLQSLIGLRQVKDQVEEFIAQTALDRRREEEGSKISDKSLHSLFLGNPGTGKTTVARILGELLYQKGIIATNKFYEVSRGDLVGGYQGQTAIKTREHLNAAIGGVLFIDEAYALKQSPNDSYGQEAIDEIMKFMEDHRRDMVVILAGYYKEMQAFLQTNSGFTSRVPYTFDFEDYTPDEIVEIGELGLKSQGFNYDRELYAAVVKEAYNLKNDNSNGRWIRNFNQKLMGQMSRRLLHDERADVNLITREDLEKVSVRPLAVSTSETKVDKDGFVVPPKS